jgi:hypothetical protein
MLEGLPCRNGKRDRAGFRRLGVVCVHGSWFNAMHCYAWDEWIPWEKDLDSIFDVSYWANFWVHDMVLTGGLRDTRLYYTPSMVYYDVACGSLCPFGWPLCTLPHCRIQSARNGHTRL